MKKELNKKGLTSEYILALSKKKQEPEWLLELRLKGLEYWNKLMMPKWAPDISELALDDILMYVETGNEMVSSWDEVPKEIKETFDKLGIPEAEQEHLAGVGAQYDSEVIYHNLKERIAKKGVIYLPMEEAIQLTKKKKEEVEVKNQAEGMLFETEKQMNELGDKVTADEKSKVDAAREDLKKAVEANDVEDIKAKIEALTQAFYPISSRIYQEAQQAQASAAGSGEQAQDSAQSAGPNGNTVDADYEVVDEDK